MSYSYPPAAPTVAGDVVSINRFLADPASVKRRVDVLAARRFLMDFLLTGRHEITGGSLLYEVGDGDNGFYTVGGPKRITPGGEYPRTQPTAPAEAIATAAKWGEEVPITDEAVGRLKTRAVETALGQVVNTIVRDVDATGMTAIGAAVTQTVAASAAWSAGGATPFLDAELAKQAIDDEDQGYDADTVVVRSTIWPYLLNVMLSQLPREDGEAIRTGALPNIAGMDWVPSNRLPAGTDTLVVDRKVFGGIGFERIPSPEYQGDPATGIQTWARRDPDANDQWLVRGRRPVVPIIQEPLAARRITGAV